MDRRICKIAIEQCKKSSYKRRVGAVVVYRGRVVGKGFNKVHSTGIPKLDGKHAEREALKNTIARYRDGAIVYVCRLTRLGTIALAKPCDACVSVMKKMGVKYVWYSINEDRWDRMTI